VGLNKMRIIAMKKTIIALCILPSLAFSTTEMQKEQYEKLESLGLPTPETGVKLVSPKKMKIDSATQNQFKMEISEMKKNGFVNKVSNRAYFLRHIDKEIEKHSEEEAKSFKFTDSSMRKSAEDIQFAYTYIGVPSSEIIKLYGVAPSGTYVNEPQAGWTGAVTFFESSFGHCAYTEDNFISSRGSALLDESLAQYDVNDKITFVNAEGNDSMGYLYRVNWFDNVFNRNLECSTEKYSEEFKNQTIELAKRIDKNAQTS
jgi:hypothetical protein